MLAALLTAVFVWTAPDVFPETELESAILDRALECSRIRPSTWPDGKPPRWFLRRLLRVEAHFGVPRELRGMVLAMACHESGYNPSAEGDHKFSRRHRPKAIGILQQWPWIEKSLGVDRRDPYEAVRGQLTHWTRQVDKTRKHCGFEGERLWATAQVRSVRSGPGRCLKRKFKARGMDLSAGEAKRKIHLLPPRERAVCRRCFDQSRHYRLLRRWRRSWEHLEDNS